MIRKPNNWENVHAFGTRQKLPVGAYVCTIKQAVVQSNSYGEQLCILFDISAGAYSGYYNNDFCSNTRTDKKWRGVYRLFLPRDDGSDKDEWTKSRLKGLLTSIEESNPGYKWDWNEKTLAGKEIGIIFRNEEWEYNGKTGWSARPFIAVSVDTVESGNYQLPDDKPLNRNDGFGTVSPVYTAPAPAAEPVAPVFDFQMLMDDDAQLPF